MLIFARVTAKAVSPIIRIRNRIAEGSNTVRVEIDEFPVGRKSLLIIQDRNAPTARRHTVDALNGSVMRRYPLSDDVRFIAKPSSAGAVTVSLAPISNTED